MGIPTIEFGTEIVSSKDGSIAALLGASPGASTSVSTMIDVIEKCFTEDGLPAAWTWKVGEFIPSNDTYLHKDKDFFEEIEKETSEVLGLTKEMAK